MNRWQREVLGNRIASEETILEELKKSYQRALKDIDTKIIQLLGRLTTEEGEINKTSIEYQLGYQKALQADISYILEQMNTSQFERISDYLTKCYEDGFIGTMYDIQHQGIPLTIPIDQKQIIKSIKNNTKLSKGLWGDLAEDNSELQNRIRREVARGLAQGSSYAKISKLLAEHMSIGYSKTARIVRTESHRISQEATLDAQYKAKDAGADVVKQWDSTLDRRTRSTHAHLDGKIVEVDEPFKYGGHEAMHPGGFGVAALDINCRCVIVQRAKWALDEEELKTLKERAEYFGLDKAKDFEEYKKKYLEAQKQVVEKQKTLSTKEIAELKKEFDRTGTPNWMETKRISQSDVEKINKQEADAIKFYTGTGNQEINKFLNGELKEVSPARQKQLSAITKALEKTITQKDMKVLRGTSLYELEGITGLKLRGKSGSAMIKELVGNTYTKTSFISTTTSEKAAAIFQKNVRMEILLPKGSKAMSVANISQNMTEAEVLIQKGAQLQIFDAKVENGKLIVRCKVVGYEK